jgi:peptide deformylase
MEMVAATGFVTSDCRAIILVSYLNCICHLRRIVLQIVSYPHPTLRHKSLPIKRVDKELRELVRNMFELMYAARGVGLAANQVDLPIRLFVVNLEAKANEGDELVFINPVVSRPKGLEEKEEGCLSLPELYGPVVRPKQIRVNAYGLDGQEIQADLKGLFARVVQHELDHLDGTLFVDRMSETNKLEIVDELDEFETEFTSQRNAGGIPGDEEIAKCRAAWEQKFC